MTDVSFRLDDLYNTEAVITLPNGRVVTVRILTDAEVNMRDLACLEASSLAEEPYSDKESEEYKSLIEPLETLDPPDLIAIIMAVRERTIREQVNAEFQYRYIPFPDEATDEEKQEVLTKRREHEARVVQRRSQESSERVTRAREELEALDGEELLRRSKNALVRTEGFTARIEEFYAQTVYLSCTDGDGSPAFDIDAVRMHGKRGGLNEKVFQRLLEVYGEIDNADPWTLEKHS